MELNVKIQNANFKDIKDYGFEDVSIKNGDFAEAWFKIHEENGCDFYIKVDNKGCYLLEEDTEISTLDAESSKKWFEVAEQLFDDAYGEEIDEENRVERLYDYADMKRKEMKENAFYL